MYQINVTQEGFEVRFGDEVIVTGSLKSAIEALIQLAGAKERLSVIELKEAE